MFSCISFSRVFAKIITVCYRFEYVIILDPQMQDVKTIEKQNNL